MKLEPGTCRFCGCTEQNACRLEDGEACAWADMSRTVCSAPACLVAWFRVRAAAEGEDIGAPPVGEREFEEARITELVERTADAAGEKRRRQRFIDRLSAGEDGLVDHHGYNSRGVAA